MRTIRTVPRGKLKGTALVRLDFNTEDEWRMEAAIPTVKFLLRHANKLVLMSHRGRPEDVSVINGMPQGGDVKRLSLLRDVRSLTQMTGRKVRFIPHFDFPRMRTEISEAPKGTIFLLENVRFLKGETTAAPETAGDLASLADYYVNDAFAVDHHPADSVNKIEKFLPSYAGLLLEKEISGLDKVLKNPKKPLLVLIGGAKAHDKLGVIKFLKSKAHAFLMGGAAANTMLYLSGVDVGKSLIDKDEKDYPDLRKALGYRNLVLPVDWHADKGAIFDIGPKTIKAYVEHIKKARTIIWSGPMGFIEKPKFEAGNLAIARAIVKNKNAFAVTGGGETVAFLKKHKLDRKFGFISTGGGAMIDYLAGKKLPGIEALKRNKK